MSDLKLHSRKAEAGVSLIDLCIALILISVIMLPMVQQYRQYLLDKEAGTNNEHMTSVDSAIAEYYFNNNKYPCPADPAQNKDSATFGHATCGPETGTGPVRTGAVPFYDLKIPFSKTLDAYSHKLVYSVTFAQTTAPIEGVPGVLELTHFLSDGVTPVTNPDDLITGVHYFIFTAGRDGVGAFSADGVNIAPCPPAATPPVRREDENCDNDADFIGDSFAKSLSTTGAAAANFSDDLFYDTYRQAVPSNIWMTSRVNAKNIYSDLQVIGINTSSPEGGLDVNGDILVSGSGTQTYVNKMCGEEIDSTDCFHPRLIIDGKTCDTAMAGIQKDNIECISAPAEMVKDVECPQGQYPIGFDEEGALQCSAAP